MSVHEVSFDPESAATRQEPQPGPIAQRRMTEIWNDASCEEVRRRVLASHITAIENLPASADPHFSERMRREAINDLLNL